MKVTIEQFKQMSRRNQKKLVHQEDLKVAKSKLKNRNPSGKDLQSALSLLGHKRHELRGFRTLIERCYKRLSEADRIALRWEMFSFYYALRDIPDAEKLIPGQPRKWIEVQSEIEVYLYLNHLSRAEELAKFCHANLHPEKRFRYENWLRLPLAKYYSHIGLFEKAMEQLMLTDPKGPWSENIPLYFAWVKVADAFETARRKLEELTGAMKESELLSDYTPFVKARRELRWFTTRLGRAFPSLKRRTQMNRKTGGVDSAGGAHRP